MRGFDISPWAFYNSMYPTAYSVHFRCMDKNSQSALQKSHRRSAGQQVKIHICYNDINASKWWQDFQCRVEQMLPRRHIREILQLTSLWWIQKSFLKVSRTRGDMDVTWWIKTLSLIKSFKWVYIQPIQSPYKSNSYCEPPTAQTLT